MSAGPGEALRRAGHPGRSRGSTAGHSSPDGDSIVTASQDGTARLWNLEGECLLVLRGHDGGVGSAEFSPDGSKILTGGSVWPVHLEDLLRLAEERGYRDLSDDERRTYKELLED